MKWADEGVILATHMHGETSAIIDVFTSSKGRYAGVVRGGASQKMAAILQPGYQVNVEWNARLENHLGHYRVEPLKSRANILQDREALAALGSVCALLRFALPERMACKNLYEMTYDLFDGLTLKGRGWLVDYVFWELKLLQELGYGLDLFQCAVTGNSENLIYISPKSGKAVSKSGAGEWASRLLPLPNFWLSHDKSVDDETCINALKITEYFLENWLAAPVTDRGIPQARQRLIDCLQRKRSLFKG